MNIFRYRSYDLRRKATWIFTHIPSIFVWEHVLLFKSSLPAHLDVKTQLVACAKLADKKDVFNLNKRFKRFRKGEAEKRIKAGNLCFVAYVDGQIAHYTWIVLGETDICEPWGKLRIESNSAYNFDGYSAPKYRGLGLGPFVFKEALDYLEKKGVSKVYALIDKYNKPSLRAAQKMGYRLVGEIIFRSILKYRSFSYNGQTAEDQQTMKRIVSFKT